jgi:hypothetical protein
MSISSWISIAALVVASAISFIALLREKPKKRRERFYRYIMFGLTGVALVVGIALIWQTSN